MFYIIRHVFQNYIDDCFWVFWLWSCIKLKKQEKNWKFKDNINNSYALNNEKPPPSIFSFIYGDYFLYYLYFWKQTIPLLKLWVFVMLLLRKSPEVTQTIFTIDIILEYPPELYCECRLLKTSHFDHMTWRHLSRTGTV